MWIQLLLYRERYKEREAPSTEFLDRRVQRYSVLHVLNHCLNGTDTIRLTLFWLWGQTYVTPDPLKGFHLKRSFPRLSFEAYLQKQGFTEKCMENILETNGAGFISGIDHQKTSLKNNLQVLMSSENVFRDRSPEIVPQRLIFLLTNLAHWYLLRGIRSSKVLLKLQCVVMYLQILMFKDNLQGST